MNENLIRSIFSGSATPVKSFADLFDLFEDGNGKFRAEYGKATAPIHIQLTWKIDEPTYRLMWAFFFSAEEFEPNGNMPHFIGRLLHLAVGDDIKLVRDRSANLEERERARTAIEKKVSGALDALFKGGKRSPHKKAGTVIYQTDGGGTREVTLAWAVLDSARQLVEETHKLPSKRDVRKRVENDFPVRSLVSFSDGQWSAAFKEAGLSSLPRAEDW